MESHKRKEIVVAPEEIEHGDFEYRSQGGEVQRRPNKRDGLPAWDAAWLVIPRQERQKELPAVVLNHFMQAGDTHALNFGRY